MGSTDRQREEGLKAGGPGARLGKKAVGLDPRALEYQPDAVEVEERPLPGAARWSLYLLALMLVVGFVWAWLSEMDRVVTARGKVVTTAPTIVVQPMDTSIVHDIAVRVGQVVAKDAVLATLDPTFTQAEVAQNRARLASLNAQVRRLQAEADGKSFAAPGKADDDERLQEDLFRKRRANYQARLKGFQESVARLEASQVTNQRDQRVLEERLRGLQEIEGMRAALQQSRHESRLKVLEAQSQRLEVERELKQAFNREAEIRHDIAKTRAEREAFVENWRQEVGEELVKTLRERDHTAEQLNKAQRKGELVELRAPAAAMVLEMARRSVGSVVKEAEPLFTLVPLEVPLEAEVQIEARDIGFVRAGDTARVKFDAFPFQRHGAALARVRSVSEDVIQQSSYPESGEEKKGGLFYVARLGVEKIELSDVPPDFRLLPGMSLTAEIKVGRRSVLSYLVYPLVKGLGESMREP
jgi:HlyD family secretion protein